MTGFIYKITNTVNGKMYIGKTQGPIEQRFSEHCRGPARKELSRRPLYAAIDKYGKGAFVIDVIEEVDIHKLAEREQYWIEHCGTYHNGYNATRGGDGKPLYEYEPFIEAFNKGKQIREIAQEYGCSTDTVQAALKLAGIDTQQNSRKNVIKRIIAKTPLGDIVANFKSQRDAARWLMQQGLTRSKNIDNIAAGIGRAANGERETAFKLVWDRV